MRDPVVAFETDNERERSIDQMVEQLRGMKPSDDPVSRRNGAILAEIIPPFVRALDRERKVFVREALAGQHDAVDKLLTVMTVPLVTMMGATITTMVPCQHPHVPCESCVDVRMAMLRNLMENLYQAVVSYVSSPITNDGPKLNS